MNNLFILIIGFITFFVSINAILYFYLKYKRKSLFDYIQNRNYTLIEKVETDIEKYSKISTKLLYRKSDIVFLDDEIFLLTYNKPIIQIGNGNERFPGVFQRWRYQSKIKTNNRLEIKGFYEGLTGGNYKISLHLKG